MTTDPTALTQREREITAFVVLGMTSGEIAEATGISQNMVKQHLHNAYRKHGVGSMVALCAKLWSARLDTLEQRVADLEVRAREHEVRLAGMAGKIRATEVGA
jgi:DNA-binding CsgD family transcriptional regulator